MGQKRRRFSREFKAKVALEALREQAPVSAIAKRHGVHPNQVSQWKRELLDKAPELFGKASEVDEAALEAHTGPLYEKIGRLEVELAFLKKKHRELS